MFPLYNWDLLDLLCRPYFQRLWTFQEVVLAQKAQIICGTDWLSWDIFSRATYVLHQKHASTGFSMYSSQITTRVQDIRLLRERLGLETPTPPVSFAIPDWHPFSQTNGFPVPSDKRTSRFGLGATTFQLNTLLSSEEKDKFFGLYAIYQKCGLQLPAPDYTKSFKELLVEAARAFIEQDCSFESVYYVGGNHKSPAGLPSWVYHPSSHYTPWIPCHEFYDASPSSEVKFVLHADHKLILYGIKVDDIVSRSSHWELDRMDGISYGWRSLNPFLGLFIPMINSMRDCLAHASDLPSPDGARLPIQRVCDVLLQEICLTYQDSYSSTEKLLELFTTWIERLLENPPEETIPDTNPELDDMYRFTTNGWKTVDEYARQFAEKPSSRMLIRVPSLEVAEEIKNSSTWKILIGIDQDKGAAMVHDTLVTRWMNNCLFTTKSGRLGMASGGLEVGDQVVLFSGFLLPMIVRPEGDYFRLISAAYVEDVMFGEEWPKDQSKLNEITIC